MNTSKTRSVELEVCGSIEGPLYVTDQELELKLSQHYSPGESTEILLRIYDFMLGSTRLKAGIYPWDLQKIFEKIDLDAVFLLNEQEISFSSHMSGIS